MHSRFPEPLKSAVLKSVQWRKSPFVSVVIFHTRSCMLTGLSGRTEVIGRLDHLVDAVFDRFKDRYYPDESMSWHIYLNISVKSLLTGPLRSLC
jgi:bromodomain adjacent to zinc finger domain protein 1A